MEVSVAPYGGIVDKSALMKQLHAARDIIEARKPNRIITFGGDCHISQAPFSYLNELYDGNLDVLWIDARTDITTPDSFRHEHAMVLGNLLEEGDPEFAKEIKVHLKPENVMFAGMDDTLDYETEVINRQKLNKASSIELAENSSPVLKWIRKGDIKHLAIHLDLDVLDPKRFRSQLFNNPDDDTPIDAFAGKMTFAQTTRLINDVAETVDTVGLTFAEHMPWDAINLKNIMEQLPIMKR